MAATKDAQLAIQRFGTSSNPKLSDGSQEIEFTYPPSADSPGPEYMENASLHTTVGGSRRKQSDSLIRVVRIKWLEPSNFIPTTILEMMYGGGDRTKTFTYTHHRPILSQLGSGVEPDVGGGIVPIKGFIQPPFRPQFAGTDIGGTQMFMCQLFFIESDEVQP
jgi:hypothetical protein